MNEQPRDHILERLASIETEIKALRCDISDIKTVFGKVCDIVGGHSAELKVLDSRMAIMARVLWGVGATVFTALVGWIVQTANQLLHYRPPMPPIPPILQ